MTALAASKESLPQPDGLRMKHNRTPSRSGEGTVQCLISSGDRALRYGRRGQGFEYLMGYVVKISCFSFRKGGEDVK